MAVCKIYTPRLSFVNGQKVFIGKIPLWDSGGLDGNDVSRFDGGVIPFPCSHRSEESVWETGKLSSKKLIHSCRIFSTTLLFYILGISHILDYDFSLIG